MFLDSIRHDPEVFQAAMAHMDPPAPPQQKQHRGLHEGLTAWAEKNGVNEIERKVRKALEAGQYGTASKLRHEALALMRQGAALVGRQLTGVSS